MAICAHGGQETQPIPLIPITRARECLRVNSNPVKLPRQPNLSFSSNPQSIITRLLRGERLIHTLNNRLRPNRFPSNKCNMAMDNLNNLTNPRECSLRFNIRQPLSLISISKRTHSNDIGLKSLPSIMMSDGIVYLELF